MLIIHQGQLLGDGRIADLAEQNDIIGAGLEALFAHLVRTTTESN